MEEERARFQLILPLFKKALKQTGNTHKQAISIHRQDQFCVQKSDEIKQLLLFLTRRSPLSNDRHIVKDHRPAVFFPDNLTHRPFYYMHSRVILHIIVKI